MRVWLDRLYSAAPILMKRPNPDIGALHCGMHVLMACVRALLQCDFHPPKPSAYTYAIHITCPELFSSLHNDFHPVSTISITICGNFTMSLYLSCLYTMERGQVRLCSPADPTRRGTKHPMRRMYGNWPHKMASNQYQGQLIAREGYPLPP